MLAASAAWEALAFELRSAATGYGSAILELVDTGWQGPSSASMALAAERYVEWMHTTAAQAERAALRAAAAAAAYEAAHAATVHPAVIAANRVRLANLVAINPLVMGTLTPAIMATEAEYMEFWAQDAAAMYAYAGASEAASMLTPMAMAPATTNPAGLATQAANGMSAIPSALNPSASTLASGFQTGIGNSVGLLSNTLGQGTSELQQLFGAQTSGLGTAMDVPAAPVLTQIAPRLPGVAAGAGLTQMRLGPEVPVARLMPAAALGQATSVGGLSVPPSWATGTSAAGPAAAVADGGTTAGAPAAAPMLPRGIPAGQAARVELREPAAPLPRLVVLQRQLVG
jgi:PPE-repeat protein